jgi:copper chaperone CopZ
MKKEFKIEGMSCHHCVAAVQKSLTRITLKNCDVTIGTIKVDFDEKEIEEDKIIRAIEEAGYRVVR